MGNFVLTSCSTADMPKEYFEERNIAYACFHFILDGETYTDDLGVTVNIDEFYKNIANGAMPTTTQLNADEFIEFFEPYLKEGKDILHLSLSSGLSGVFNSARIAQEELAEKYPDRKLYIVDTLAASSGQGLLVDIAADLRDSGASIDEAREKIESIKLNIHHWFFSTDLTHFKRGGRISSASAIAGTLLNICPLLNVSHEGKLVSREKIRGKKKVIERIVQKMVELAEGGVEYNGKCFISNAASYDDARAIADLVEAKFPNLAAPVMINNIGTVIGSHTGPGTVALFFVGEERIS